MGAHRLKSVLSAALLTVTTLVVSAETSIAARNDELRFRPAVNVSGDSGGAIIKYAMHVAKLRTAKSQVRFTGRCASACTLLLSLPKSQICIAPGASFRFHAPRHPNATSAAAAKRYMLSKYPAWVLAFVRQQRGLTSQLVTMNYQYASRFIRPCSVRQARR